MLDKFLVTMGVKGQDVVLATMDKIQKKKNAVKKPFKVQMQSQMTGARQEKKLPEERRGFDFPRKAKDASNDLEKFRKSTEKGTSAQNKENKETEKAVGLAKKTGKNAKQGAANAAGAASSLNPVSFLKTMASLPGEALSAIPFIGGIGKALSGAVGMATEAASGALNSAKENASKYYGLSQRNASSAYYGGDINFSKKQNGLSSQAGSYQSVSGNYAPKERAELIASVSGVFGKIQKPLASTLSKMIQGNQYDVGALSRVSSGDWRSTGTDKGFFLQKLADSFGDLPPTIAQKFQSRLLENYGAGEIQKSTEEQRGAQATTGAWESKDELMTKNLYDVASKNIQSLLELNESLNQVQIKLVSGGAQLSSVINGVAAGMNQIFEKANSAFSKNSTPGKK